MDELTLDGKKYLSSKRAAKVTGYAKDYVGQLCREGRVDARLVGRNWYVLESSILEHRFGAESVDGQEAAVATPVATRESVWVAPRYIPETSPSIPPLVEKPAVEPQKAPEPMESSADPRAVLENMQSAWKEWFDEQEKALPDASEMLLADHEEAPEATAALPEPHNVPVIIEKKQENQAENAEPSVHIERKTETAPVRIARREDIFDLRAARSANLPVTTANFVPSSPNRASTGAPKRKNANFAARAVFIAIAVVAVAIAAIGSGALDQALEHAGGPFTDFFSGKQSISK